MRSIIFDFEDNNSQNLYIQIFDQIKARILSGEFEAGMKLPSLRGLAKANDISVTTVETAYNQLLVEGYIESRPKSGYYVSDDISGAVGAGEAGDELTLDELLPPESSKTAKERSLIYDEESFEFSKWKKCMSKVFNEYAYALQTEADVQGEAALRYEIAKYLYAGRGVKCSPEQVVIGAGSQQLATHLIRILRDLGISNAAMEFPGYGPVREIFKDEGVSLSNIPVRENGITIERLPVNMRSLVYVNPSNQFPSGAVMPIGRRYELIKWAEDNDSYILEDDYDSELRYFGKPIPALQGLDRSGRVVYLGSFSSTLFASIKISYMVLPHELVEVFNRIKSRYAQTCSKAEPICLALYMEDGADHRHSKKCRKRNAEKLHTTMEMFKEYGDGLIEAIDSKSGLAVMLRIMLPVPAEQLCQLAKNVGLMMNPVSDLCTEEEQVLYFYFYRVSEPMLRLLIKMYVGNIKKGMRYLNE